ncbi:type I pullulanase [Candidatus Izemoplasma sp. B36]|uniref:type I pullulanase n=1 Tax=Candidatus Izemoplasma sp. B36 TaxID=3242468 RepID=UPI003557040B
MTKNKRPFYCYLDDFDELTIIIPIKNYCDTNKYFLVGNDEIIKLNISQKINLGIEIKLICYFDAYINLRKVYFVENQNKEMSELYTGKIVRTELFDNIYRYKKNDLGFSYTKTSTKFKLWTPVAKYVKIELISPNNKKVIYDLTYKNSGVWRAELEGDFEGYKYRYLVYVNGKETIVTDPYAITSNANGEYAYVVDKDNFYQMKHSSIFSGNMNDAIIYEMNVRDFTIDPDMNFKHKGKFLGVIESGVKTKKGLSAGIDYLKELGITHIQLMPIFDFEGVDETNPNLKYNWGYNPVQYFVPEGWYSTNPNDPYARINELKEMIDALHANGLNVVMDVVFNHVNDATKFPYEKTVPGYSFHVDKQGMLTNISGCNNDIASHRKMMRKMIIDNILYWATEYKIDGFRFDLMGLIDFETMNELRQELHDLDEHIIVYGEGWNMYSSNLTDRMAHMQNKKVIHTIGFFNDKFRETIKGATFNHKDKGFSMGNTKEIETVKQMLLGSANNRYMFKYTSQSINYIECHDNLTYFDKGLHITSDIELLKKQQLFANSIVLLSQGVPFIHAGQEFYRTKQKDENSYSSSDKINLIDWSRREAYNDAVQIFKKLIKIRKENECFKLISTSEMNRAIEIIELESKTLMMHLNEKCNLLVMFKPINKQETIIIPEGYAIMLATNNNYKVENNYEYILEDIGTYIFRKDTKTC